MFGSAIYYVQSIFDPKKKITELDDKVPHGQYYIRENLTKTGVYSGIVNRKNLQGCLESDPLAFYFKYYKAVYYKEKMKFFDLKVFAVDSNLGYIYCFPSDMSVSAVCSSIGSNSSIKGHADGTLTPGIYYVEQKPETKTAPGVNYVEMYSYGNIVAAKEPNNQDKSKEIDNIYERVNVIGRNNVYNSFKKEHFQKTILSMLHAKGGKLRKCGNDDYETEETLKPGNYRLEIPTVSCTVGGTQILIEKCSSNSPLIHNYLPDRPANKDKEHPKLREISIRDSDKQFHKVHTPIHFFLRVRQLQKFHNQETQDSIKERLKNKVCVVSGKSLTGSSISNYEDKVLDSLYHTMLTC